MVPRVLRPRRAAPADAVRPTRAEINLDALRRNLRVVRAHAGSARVWAVLKADAYGHGAPAVARTLERSGVDGFCVALLEEGVELREAGITAPILLMGGHYDNAHGEVIARGLVPVVYDAKQVEAFARLVRAGAVPGPIDVHLKVDTGMGRLGVTLADLSELGARLAAVREVHVRGLMTHLACADAEDDGYTLEQMARFDEAVAGLARHGIRPDVLHAANSAAVLRARARLDAARPGLALFGVAPRAGEARSLGLRPVMRVRTEVVALRDVGVGACVGYDSTWRAERPSRIATLPMGYADGLPRRLGNRGHVLLRGRKAPIVGAVSMDMTMIDATAVPDAAVGDEVVILGAQDGEHGSSSIGAEEIAVQADMIAWEVFTGISRRVPRFYREP